MSGPYAMVYLLSWDDLRYLRDELDFESAREMDDLSDEDCIAMLFYTLRSRSHIETRARLKGVRMKTGEVTKTLISSYIQAFEEEVKTCGNEFMLGVERQANCFYSGLTPRVLKQNVRLSAGNRVQCMTECYLHTRVIADELIQAAAMIGVKT